MKRVKEFISNNKVITLIVLLLVILVGLFVIFTKTNVDHVKWVSKKLPNKYYKIDCMNDDCDYIIAYKGKKIDKNKISIYNAEGKKIASYKEVVDLKNLSVRNISAVNENYIIFNKSTSDNNGSINYSLANTKGKEVYSTTNKLTSINDYLISEKLDENYKLMDNKGKEIYSSVKNIKSYSDGKIITANIKNEEFILNEKGETILNGYIVRREVKDENNNSLYLILQDSNMNAYYYYSLKSNKIVGDSFNSYIDGSNPGELVITKKSNTELIKYILKQNGKVEKLNSAPLDDLKGIDTSKYEIVTESYLIKNQISILVKNNNSFGTYNLKTNIYTRLIDGTPSNLSKLLSNEKDLYVGIYYDNTLIVYDLVNDKKVYELNSNDFSVLYYSNYGDYNVVKYSSESSDDYKNKYAVYNNENKEVYRGEDPVVIVDKEFVFGKEPNKNSIVLFNAKKNKALNNHDSLASKETLGKTYFYKYVDGEKTYIYNSKGEKLKTINNNNVSFIYSTDTIIYINNNKVNILNPTDNRTITYRLKENERISASDGEIIPPYKNTLFINNPVNNYMKVVSTSGRTIRKMRKQNIESINYNKKTNRVIIVTKKVKKNNSYYGLYIGR